MNSQPGSPAPEPPKIERLTYSVAEAATALGVSQPTIYRFIMRRMLRPVQGLRHKRIPCVQVRKLVSCENLPGRN